MDMTKLFKKEKGRGRGGGRGSGDGRGRGRGRGRGSTAANKAINVINLDDDDELCNMALEQAELNHNSLTKSFEVLNAASQLEGFDSMTGGIWIYPTNRPVRDYQYEIVKTALFNNTLVSLPTGLGKTFISAVVMYNFQRWYPTGIIVFMAPTRPLVTQQLDACHNTVGISPAKTVELTGQIAPKKRQQLWQTKTVFFLTPQVMLSDLERNFFDPDKVRCIVVDEAHKALGNHAFVQVITKISQRNRLFRVLALSATPGSDIVAVKQVFKNLLISRVELRSEDSLDILPYIHEKKVDKIVVKLDQYLTSVHERLLEVFQVYSGKLMKANALTGRDGTSYSKFQLLKAREVFRNDLAMKIPNYQKGYIEVDYAICISLAHAIEILLSHGLRTFYIFLHGVLNKEKGTPAVSAELRKNTGVQNVLDEVQQKLNISHENSTFDFDLNTSGLFSTVDNPKLNVANRSFLHEDIDYTLSHPKLKILKDIVHKHFLEHQIHNRTTRIMIFSQYRDSVQEIGNMLNSLRPLVKPMVFIGQSSNTSIGRGLKQKDQVQVVQQFRDGGFNVLVSTSVGEEGLDIGEVDLIVCFDASKSPTRLIQRMGRTGRQREGRTVFLLTYGKEERSYLSSITSHSSISRNITDPVKLQPFLYKQSPRMVPPGIEPVCYKMSIILSTEQSSQPEPMQVDIDDDDGDEVQSKSKPVPVPQNTKKKQPTTGRKNKKDAAGAGTNKPTGSENILKCFERMNKAASQPSSRKQATEVLKTKDDEPIFIDNDDGYGLEEGMHMFAVNNAKAFNSLSVYPKIFDIDKSERLEWKPCTTFVKQRLPSSDAVSSFKMITKLDCLILDDKALSAVDRDVKSRESFSYQRNDFCGCGNTMESHNAKRDHAACYNAIKSSVLDQSMHGKPSTVIKPTWKSSTIVDKSSVKDSTIFKEPSIKNSTIFNKSSVKESIFNKSSVKESIFNKSSVVDSTFFNKQSVKKSTILEEPLIRDTTILDRPLRKDPASFDKVLIKDKAGFEKSPSKNVVSSSSDKSPMKDAVNLDEFTTDSIILDQPFIDEEFDDDLTADFFEDFFNLSPAISENIQALSPKDKAANILPKTPVKNVLSDSSDDEVRSQYSASPEIGQNRFLEKLKEIKAAAAAKTVTCAANSHASVNKELQPSIQRSVANDQLDVTSLQSSCKKKFIFKKKTMTANLLEEQPLESLDQSHEMSPSPPLSPILNLPRITNDFYESPKSRTPLQYDDNVEDIPDAFWDDNFDDSPLQDNARDTGFTVQKSPNASTSSFKFRKPIKFLKSTSENKNVDNISKGQPHKSPTDYWSSTTSHVFENASSTRARPREEFNVGNAEEYPSMKVTPASTSIKSSLKVIGPRQSSPVSSILKQGSYKNRPSLKVAKPSVWKYGCDDISVLEDQQEPRPIVRTYPAPANITATKQFMDEPKKIVSNNPTRDKFTKSPSVSSTVSSTFNFNTNARPVKNVLSRNRHKKQDAVASSSSAVAKSGNVPSTSSTTAKTFAAPPLTPPRMVDADLSDDSPEIIFTKRVVLSPQHSMRRISNNREQTTTPVTPLSTRRSGKLSRLRISDPVSASRSVTRSPSAIQSRFSRETSACPSLPVSREVSHVSSRRSPSSSPFVNERRHAKPKNRKDKANPFIDAEADVSGDDSDTAFGDENFEFDGLDDIDDSFVTNGDDDDRGVTESQQVMYLESVKDAIPARFGRIEKPLSPKNYGNEHDLTEESYEDDSFCQQDDDVEYADVGVFTQAMNQARVDLAVDSSGGRRTRRGKREALAVKNSKTVPPKQRRRIVTMDDTSDDDDDFK